MKCEGCGAELVEGARHCTACGREIGVIQRASAETARAAEKTGEVVGKVGRGLVGGVKAFGSGAKKGFKPSDEEQSK